MAVLEGGYLLDLTLYEVGNAIWKEAKLLRRISVEDALKLLQAVLRVSEHMQFVKASGPETLRVAYELGITFYDASYVAAAGRLGAILVTDDGELRERVKSMKKTLVKLLGRHIETRSSHDLLGTG